MVSNFQKKMPCCSHFLLLQPSVCRVCLSIFVISQKKYIETSLFWEWGLFSFPPSPPISPFADLCFLDEGEEFPKFSPLLWHSMAPANIRIGDNFKL